MATAAATTTVFSMKLLIDPKAQRVVFAEAGKDVVDFLFYLLALPVSTAVKLLGKDSVGSIGSLHASVEELDDTYVLQGAASKGALLRPAAAALSAASLLCLPEPSSSSAGPAKTINGYTCFMCRRYVTDVSGKKCPVCGNSMGMQVQYLYSEPAAGSAGEGFVQGIVTYTVLDNLTVTPVSAISGIALLNTLAVTDIGALQEKTVQVGYNEGLAILKASLQSKTVLTDVFLGNNVVDSNNVDYVVQVLWTVLRSVELVAVGTPSLCWYGSSSSWVS